MYLLANKRRLRAALLALVAVGALGYPGAAYGDHDGYGGGSDGNTGYEGEGGRSGDMEQDGERNCRNFCDNTIIIPPSQEGGEKDTPQR